MLKKDPQENCELCKMLYGMEKPKAGDLCNSKNCIALIIGKTKKPDLILIFPKIHEMDIELVKKQKELRAEIDALIRRTKQTLRKEYGAKHFRVAWYSGGMLLRLTAHKKKRLKSSKAHAHCKMNVFYK